MKGKKEVDEAAIQITAERLKQANKDKASRMFKAALLRKTNREVTFYGR